MSLRHRCDERRPPARPRHAGDYNFYDPDDFLSVSAMLYSFDPAVHEQVRRLIETNGLYLCPQGAPKSRCDYGQMIHHFVPSCDGDPSCVCQSNQWNPLIQDCYTYQAISSASQSGPNIFWTLSALRYASVTGNATWLAGYMPKIRVSMQFLLDKFDASVGLFNVPGSLQIDTFIRQVSDGAIKQLCRRILGCIVRFHHGPQWHLA